MCNLFKKSSTYCAIAKCLEDLQRPFEEIRKTYMKALQCAEESGHNSVVVILVFLFSSSFFLYKHWIKLAN